MSWPDGVPLNGECFDYTWSDTPTFTDDSGRVHVALTAFHHANQDLASDPVSTNRRFQSDIPVLGTVVVPVPPGIPFGYYYLTVPLHRWGTTCELIFVMW